MGVLDVAALPAPGAWAALTAYVRGQVVTYSGAAWMATNSFTSGASFNPTNWTYLGTREFGFPYTVDPGMPRGSDFISVGGVNNAVYARIHEWGAITKLGLWVGTQSGNISVAGYTNSGTGRGSTPVGGQLGGKGLTASRAPTDGVTTNASPTVTSAAAAFVATDVGKSISGTNIPASSFIGVVNSATSVGLSSVANANTPVNATGTGSGITLTIAGGIACPPSGYAELTLDGSGFTLLPGDWLSLSVDNNTATFFSLLASGASNSIGLGRQFTQGSGTPFPCPSTPSSLTAAAGRTLVLIGVP